MYFLEIQILFYGSCIVALAGLIRGFAGFGNMMIMSPGLSLIFGPVMAIPMIYIIELPIVTFFLFKLFKKIQWNKIIILASVMRWFLWKPSKIILLCWLSLYAITVRT